MPELNKNAVMKKLEEVKDPEMGISIVALGLIYGVKIDKGLVIIDMTLTSPACPIGPLIMESVEESAKKISGVKGVTINLVWEPTWSTDMMSEEAKTELGIN